VAGFGQDLDVVFDRNPLDVEEWRARLDESGAGQAPIEVPVRIVQGDADLIVYQEMTDATVEQMCELGGTVEYEVVPDVDHAVVTADRVLPWIAARFAGEEPSSTCP
jgi:hypothetical protein